MKSCTYYARFRVRNGPGSAFIKDCINRLHIKRRPRISSTFAGMVISMYNSLARRRERRVPLQEELIHREREQ